MTSYVFHLFSPARLINLTIHEPQCRLSTGAQEVHLHVLSTLFQTFKMYAFCVTDPAKNGRMF